jgi:hypothetical protein
MNSPALQSDCRRLRLLSVEDVTKKVRVFEMMFAAFERRGGLAMCGVSA